MRQFSQIPYKNTAENYITTKSDIYQLGLIFGFVLIDEEFNLKRSNVKSGDTIEQAKAELLAGHRKQNFLQNGVNDYITEYLIKNMLQICPELRFDAENVVKNPYFWNTEQIESFITQIILDYKGHSSNEEESKKIDKNAKEKVFLKQPWIEKLPGGFGYEVNKWKNASKFDTTSFLDLLKFIIDVVSIVSSS